MTVEADDHDYRVMVRIYGQRLTDARRRFPTMSRRVLYRLVRSRIDLDHLASLSDADVLALRDFGPVSLREFRAHVSFDPTGAAIPNWTGEGVP